jgi:hypothetical protein
LKRCDYQLCSLALRLILVVRLFLTHQYGAINHLRVYGQYSLSYVLKLYLKIYFIKYTFFQVLHRKRSSIAQRSVRSRKLSNVHKGLGWVTKIYYLQLLSASESTLSRWLHLQLLASIPFQGGLTSGML